jgi:hypothetical protein
MSCLTKFLSYFLFLPFAFQPVHIDGSPNYDRGSLPASVLDSGAPRSSCWCTEYLSRISDLEGCLSLMKCQARIALDKASKSHGLMKQISILEDKVSSLVARITHFEECDSFLVGIVESVCEMLLCKVSRSLLFFFCSSFCELTLFAPQVLAWILLASRVGSLNGSWLLRRLHRGLTV